MRSIKSIEGLLSDIEHLQEAKRILDKIYGDIDPYGNREISEDTRNELLYYYKFDDSE